jgi:Mg2+ and Co2+ transporter CorA
MSEEERQLCLQDPRVFASDLLKTSALSWKFFLSFLHSQHHSISGDPAAKADQLHRDKETLDRARLYFRDAIAFMKHRNRLEWPTCRLPEDRVAVEAIMTSLLEDFKDLDDEAASLSRACNDFIRLEMNMISILDSKKSIEQADRVQKLTFLAYLFVPMSFITGIFSMNMKEFNGTIPALWLYFAIVVPVAICFALIPLWQDIIRIFARAKLAMRHIFVGYSARD